jgi:ribonucleoside-triphosphate reductase
MAKVEKVRKRDGRIVPYNETKIADAIFKAALSVGGEDRFLAEELSRVVTLFLEKKYEGQVPGIEDIQDMVEKVLIETGHAKTAKAYILYREKRARIRESLKVRHRVIEDANPTDTSLLVDPVTKDEVLPWSKGRIATALEIEADLNPEVAAEIAGTVEKRIFDSGLKRVSTSLIRELVDNELFERGFGKQLYRQRIIGMPKFDVEQLIFSKSKENSNIASNNPEAINLAIAENSLKQFALQEVFSPDVAEAHLAAVIHLHDLGYPTRVYCSSHSLEYLKKYGLHLSNLDTCSAPAKHARTLTGHLNTFLASMQAFYAGALGVGYLNILYAPYLEGMSDDQLRQEAQHLIYSGSQNAFSRGGQTLFLDFNIHTGIPDYLKDVPAIGPGGKETGKVYGDYAEIAMRFCRAMLDIWRAGDQFGHVFAFPKCDFHVSEDTFKDRAQYELLKYACQVASENGSPYFVFDRDAVTLAACCRLRTKIEDTYMIRHPESMRFCGFQNVTINLPQAAYRSHGDMEKFYSELDRACELSAKAHLEKRKFIQRLMSSPQMPLWEIGRPALDGRPYVDLEKVTYIIGLIGLNEAVEYLTGRELHEGEEPLKLGLQIISHMYFWAKEATKRFGLKFSLEESPAESATRRLAKVDARLFPEADRLLRGNKERDERYYTNSIHLRADAPVDLVTRIQTQAKFHRLIESGAIIHAFVGESRPPAESILNLVHKTYLNTEAAQLTISPEFTICNSCNGVERGMKQTCARCGSPKVYGVTRIVGYFSRVDNWNKSKLGELADRQKGNYAVV